MNIDRSIRDVILVIVTFIAFRIESNILKNTLGRWVFGLACFGFVALGFYDMFFNTKAIENEYSSG